MKSGKIIGIGTDCVYIPRIERLHEQYSVKLIEKILTKEELSSITFNGNKQLHKYIAKRFAAKEALVKALGSGFRDGLTLRDISVLNDSLGKPFYKLSQKLCTYISQITDNCSYTIHLSISDDYPIATAFTIIQLN